MPQYLSPGVYVEEVPSAVKAIAGVGTSTAGFIGIVPNELVTEEKVGTGDGSTKVFKLAGKPLDPSTAKVKVAGTDTTAVVAMSDAGDYAQVTFDTAPASGSAITVNYGYFTPVMAGAVKLCTNFTEYKKFFGDFSSNEGHAYLTHAVYGFFNNGGSRCYVARVAPAATSPAAPEAAPAASSKKSSKSSATAASADTTPAPAAPTPTASPDISSILEAFEAVDEIAIVVAPGFTDKNSRDAITTHCSQKTKDRFAIFDSPQDVETNGSLDLMLLDSGNANTVTPPNSDYAAFYFPWIQVFDPATQAANPGGDGMRYVPPSGHVAGVYARVDNERGVHKAPANETVLGALGLRYNLSKSQQDGLNPKGVNCIRAMNGNIRIWGARTVGGDANTDLKYINVRRTLIYLRESIDEGTQWVVFEPNTPALWQKITRNVTAFLTNVWRSGALFGTTAAEAFYVKCDAETNPPELRELGQVVTEIGVAIVRPAEFVIFRISQFSAPSQ
jgi:Bacteriophage tail sheath protein